MKKGNVIVLILFLLFTFMKSGNAAAKTLGDLRKEYNDLVSQAQENKNKTQEEKNKIAQNQAAIKQAEVDIAIAQGEMESAQLKIDESNQRISALKGDAEKALKYLQQMQGENAYVEYVSGATTITDLISRIAEIEQLSDFIQKAIKELESEIKQNEELKQELKEKTEALERQKVIYKAAIEASYDRIEEYDKYALDIDKQVEVAKESLDSQVQICKDTIGETGDEVVIEDCVYPDKSYVPDNGRWLKPLTTGIITSTVQSYRSLGALSGSHNALDIASYSPFEGTEIYAAAAGVVAGKAYRYSCGGNMLFVNVMVDGEKYTTYYYHLLNFNVEVGDIVTQNTVLGWVGGYSTSTAHGGYDYCTTGAHLHFGVARGWYGLGLENPMQIKWANVIVPPGFPNQYGWRFYSRTDMY